MTSPVSPSETIAKAMEGVTNKVTWSVEGYDDATGQVNVVGDGFFIAGVIANQPNQEATAAYIAACNPVAMREVLDELYALRETALQLEAMERRAEDAEALAERLKLEAQSHAMEARTANSTIAEIYQVVSGGSGELGNWHGATPVREKLEAMQREMAEKDERIAALEKAMKPFSMIAAMEENAEPFTTVMVNVDRCRDARTVLDGARTLIQGEKK